MQVTVVVDRYPELSQTFVTEGIRGLRSAGLAPRVEALAHPADPAPGEAPPDACWEDDTRGGRLAAALRLTLRHPVRVARDLRARRLWREEEWVPPLRWLAPGALRIRASGARHLHAEFAGPAALCALRLSRLLGIPYSVTAHGYDIYAAPANLAAKLREAAFAVSGSAYTCATLRDVEPLARVHEVVMGVDMARFRPGPPPEGPGRRVLAVGRLVEKKGFTDLVEAAARLPAGARVQIVGDGPLRPLLERRIAALGAPVELLGSRPNRDLPELLATADVFCMPCVVAPDGDRDSMPVVVKEALACAVPVVATREVGLPEVVRHEWGRLVSPHDPEALAAALSELLALPAHERRAMGERGRAFVAEHADVWKESARLAALMRAAA